jgi:hypothetical protein
MFTAMMVWIAISCGFFAGAFFTGGLRDAAQQPAPIRRTDEYMTITLSPNEYVRL